MVGPVVVKISVATTQSHLRAFHIFVHNSIMLTPMWSQMKALIKSFPMVCFYSKFNLS